MINIMYLNHTPSVSGAEVSLLSCIEKLPKSKYSPLLICPLDGPLVDKAREMGIRVETIEMAQLTFTHNPTRLLLFLFSLLKTTFHLIPRIKKYHIDLVHANSVRAGILGGIAAQLTKTPVIWHVRDFLPSSLLGNIIRWMSGLQATRIVVISKAVKSDFCTSQRQKEKTIIVYDGVDLQKYNPSVIDASSAREALSLAHAFPVVGIIGQIIDWKGQKEFIRAASRVAKTFPQARFLIVGEALFRKHKTLPYKQELIDLAKEVGVAEKVVFTGFREDIPQIISTLDILVLASWNEPLGMVQLEAMAMETPIVATNAGGTREIVQDGLTGILVPPQDPQAIADAVIDLAKNKDRLARMGRAGRKRTEQHFSLDMHVQKVEHLYDEVLA